MRKPWMVLATVMAISWNWGNLSLAQESPSSGTKWLLSSPMLQHLSGAGETFLLLKHSLLPRVPPTARGEDLDIGILSTDVRVNNPAADTGASRTQSEPSIAVFGSNVVIGWNDSGEFEPSGNFTGYGFSSNGGATFTDAGPLAGPPGGNTFGDPIVAADHLGNFYFASLASDASDNSIIGVAKSTNGGQTFGPQVEASVGASNPNDFQDKENMAVDTSAASPFRGNIYVCWTDFLATGGNRIMFSRSTNGAASFSSAIGISTSGALVQGCAIAIGPSGEIYVAWEDFREPQAIRVSKSIDGGVSFGAGGVNNTIVSEVISIGRPRLCNLRPLNIRFVLNGFMRVNDFPGIAVHPTNGQVYVVFNSNPEGGDQADVFFTRSTNGGATWSTPIRVNDDATTADQWFPAVAVQPSGRIGIMWYDRRLDPGNFNIDVFMATSTDGGVTFSPNTRVTDTSFGVPPIRPRNFDPIVASCYMGDYNGITADATQFYLSWGDNRDITSGIPDPNVYSDRVP